MKGKIYFINELNFKSRNAGYKARNDICRVAKEKEKIKVINMPLWGNVFSRMLNLPVFLIYFCFFFKSSDLIILQYPFPKPFIKLAKIFSRLKGFNLSFIIHDVDILRGQRCNEDIDNLNFSKINITHNKFMAEELIKIGVKSKSVEINIFDYFIADEPNVSKIESNALIFCGNLNKEKSGFIYDWDSPCFERIVYGVNHTDEINKKNKYVGSFDANVPPQFTTDSDVKVFGLVWDGPSTSECKGNYGDYLRFNNPHKTSLYLAMGLPIIIWKSSAIYKYLCDMNVALGVDDLSEVKSIYENISQEKYDGMVRSVSKLKNDVVNGKNTENALNLLIEYFEDQ